MKTESFKSKNVARRSNGSKMSSATRRVSLSLGPDLRVRSAASREGSQSAEKEALRSFIECIRSVLAESFQNIHEVHQIQKDL